MAQYGGQDEVRIPDVEVLIQAAASDVALVCFYVPKSPHEDVEVVATIDDIDTIGAVRAVLQMALQALNQQRWVALDELDTRAAETKTDPPFWVKGGSVSKGS